MNNIEKAYSINKKWFHGIDWHKGCELHHIFGRVGIFKACRLNMAALTREEHANSLITDYLREDSYALRLQIQKNYNRTTGKCDKKINVQCEGCPLTDTKK